MQFGFIAGLFLLLRRDVLQPVLWRGGHTRQCAALRLGYSQWVVSNKCRKEQS